MWAAIKKYRLSFLEQINIKFLRWIVNVKMHLNIEFYGSVGSRPGGQDQDQGWKLDFLALLSFLLLFQEH